MTDIGLEVLSVQENNKHVPGLALFFFYEDLRELVYGPKLSFPS